MSTKPSDKHDPSLVPFLNHDLLTYIFQLNTNTSETESGYGISDLKAVSPLNTTRYTSQVCRSWRQIILRSAGIWANTIDLEALSAASDKWTEEVMRRTGNASLSIYGCLGSDDETLLQTFTSLLDKNWHRVRRLDILIMDDDESDDVTVSDAFWNIFWKRPAPSLESFLVNLDLDNPLRPDKWNGLQLFAGSAPRLCRIHAPDFRFDHRAPWISQLRSVTLSSPLTTLDALAVISLTPHLESLAVQMSVKDDKAITSWTKPIYLPNLHLLDIASTVVGSSVYLSNITARSDCALVLMMQDRSQLLRDPDILTHLQHISKIILRYAEGYFIAHRPTKLEISIDLQNFSVSITSLTGKEKAEYFGHPTFKVEFASWPDPQLSDHSIMIIKLLLSTLSTCILSTVSDFTFTFFHSPSWRSTSQWSPKIVEVPIQTFQSLTSVKTITLTPSTMHILNNLPDSDFTSLFPHLIHLVASYSTNEYTQLVTILRLFLKRRQASGNPVRKLHLTPSDRSSCVHSMDDMIANLKEFEGLDSFFRSPVGQVEYLCGSKDQ